MNLAVKKKKPKYLISDSDFGECSSYEPRWACYSVDGSGESVKDFLDSVCISVIDQEGEDLNNMGFWEAETRLQTRILSSAGITWKEAEQVEE